MAVLFQLRSERSRPLQARGGGSRRGRPDPTPGRSCGRATRRTSPTTGGTRRSRRHRRRGSRSTRGGRRAAAPGPAPEARRMDRTRGRARPARWPCRGRAPPVRPLSAAAQPCAPAGLAARDAGGATASTTAASEMLSRVHVGSLNASFTSAVSNNSRPGTANSSLPSLLMSQFTVRGPHASPPPPPPPPGSERACSTCAV